jgi:hypothetical protein
MRIQRAVWTGVRVEKVRCHSFRHSRGVYFNRRGGLANSLQILANHRLAGLGIKKEPSQIAERLSEEGGKKFLLF